MKPLLQVKNLCVDYLTEDNLARAVDDVSFDIHSGETLGLAGESGCGKSTVAFAIARLTRLPGFISDGQILFDGTNLLSLKPKALKQFQWQQLSVVLQSAMNALNPVLKISEQLTDVVLTHRRMSKSQALQEAKEVLSLVGIHPDRIHDYPHQFSGGMKQRIGIALALILRPKLVIMDEPTTALDVVVQRSILGQIKQIQKQMQFAILFITHDLNLMLEFADRVGVMYAGEIVELAPSQSLLNVPGHPYSQALMHSTPELSPGTQPLQSIPGHPPALTDLPSGCRFADRCQYFKELCNSSVPEHSEAGTESRVDKRLRCHFPLSPVAKIPVQVSHHEPSPVTSD